MFRSINLILKDEERERQENKGCRIAKCYRCGKEFYTIGKQHKLCKECRKLKEKRKLLKEQYRIANRLGLLAHKK